MRAYTRAELLDLTPDEYLADGFDPDRLTGELATAAAYQLQEGEVAPQELAFTAAALDQTVALHQGSPAEHAQAAVAEALQIVARMIRQPNNPALADWLEGCAAEVRQPGDVPALQQHVQAVLQQYALITSFTDEAEPALGPS